METCKTVPYTGAEYCYGKVWLAEHDVLFIVVVAAALVAITIGWAQGKIK